MNLLGLSEARRVEIVARERFRKISVTLNEDMSRLISENVGSKPRTYSQ